MNHRILSFLTRWSVALSWVYYTCLFGWAFFYVLTGDRYGIVALINSLAVYLFLPLPLILPLALLTRRRELWIGLGVGSAIFLWLWGGYFVPRTASAHAADAPAITVMTYNALGLQTHIEPVLDVIRAENADVVCLQEVNNALADSLQTELIDEYPYQYLDPIDDVRGMGAISRYPIELKAEQLPFQWIGTPEVFALDWQGQSVTLINFHTFAAGLGTPEAMDYNNRTREIQALVLAESARTAAANGPVIACGDANTTPLSDAYRTITRDLKDSWREVGFGFGHTFPGSDIKGSSRPRIYGWPVPQWLARIDYVFHSNHWQAVEAHAANFDGVSDHRGVVVRLIAVK